MIQQPSATVSDTHLERRTVQARRRALGGDWQGAATEYETLWPHTKDMPPVRRLRFLSLYAEVLLHSHTAFERLRAIAAESALLCYRQSREYQDAQSVRRYVNKITTVLHQVARDVGFESAMGQTLLDTIWAIASALSGRRTDQALPQLLAVQIKYGDIVWLFRGSDRYYLTYPQLDGPTN